METIEKFRTLIEFGKRVSAERDIEKLISLLTEEACHILEAERATVFILNKDEKKLWSLVGVGLKSQKIEIPYDKGIAGYVARKGVSLNISDAYKDERFNKEIDIKTGFITKTILAVPMRNLKGEIIGVFQVLNKKDTVFTVEDEEILNIISSQAAVSIENSNLYIQLKKSFSSFIEALAQTLDARDHLTSGHTLRVANLSMLIGKKMGFKKEELEVLHDSAWLHDIGKIGIREYILTKPGKLTDEEFQQMKQHTAITKRILEKINFPKDMKDIPLIASSHHERYDGKGYNRGLKKTEIPLGARIIAVADVFDALTSKRHYREPMPILEVFGILDKGKGNQFDPRVVETFFSLSVYEVIEVIKMGREVFEVIKEEQELLKGISVRDFFNILKKSDNTAFEHKIIEVFNKKYLDNLS